MIILPRLSAHNFCCTRFLSHTHTYITSRLHTSVASRFYKQRVEVGGATAVACRGCGCQLPIVGECEKIWKQEGFCVVVSGKRRGRSRLEAWKRTRNTRADRRLTRHGGQRAAQAAAAATTAAAAANAAASAAAAADTKQRRARRRRVDERADRRRRATIAVVAGADCARI